jgi:hypothetical protein
MIHVTGGPLSGSDDVKLALEYRSDDYQKRYSSHLLVCLHRRFFIRFTGLFKDEDKWNHTSNHDRHQPERIDIAKYACLTVDG